MTPAVAVLSLLAGLFVVALFRLGERMAPGWLVPAHRALAFPAASMAGLMLVILEAAGGLGPALDLLMPGLARRGPQGALSLWLVALALLLVCYLGARAVFAITRPRDPDCSPVPRWMWLLGVAPDGSATPIQASLRLGGGLVVVCAWLGAGLLPVEASGLAVTTWGTATLVLTGLGISLHPGRTPDRPKAAVADPPMVDDRLARWLAAAGGLTPLPGEAAIDHHPASRIEGGAGLELWSLQRRVRAAEHASAVTVAGPLGSGRRTAALLWAYALHQRTGRRILWLGETPLEDLRERLDLQAHLLSGQLARGPSPVDIVPLEVVSASDPDAILRGDEPPCAIIVELDRVAAGVELARLRYAIHRVGTVDMSTQRPSVLVLGTLAASAMLAATRAIAAKEPVLITADSPLATRAIRRFLIEGRLDRLSSPPPGGACLDLHRPTSLPRYPGPDVGPVHELVALPGGPRGRRLRDWLMQTPNKLSERRLLLALPGDREVPERRLHLAREALRHSLGEHWQERQRLYTVFSRPLVDATLLALGARVEVRRTLEGQVWVRAVGLVPEPSHQSAIVISEPRSGTSVSISQDALDWVAFEGAIVDGHEVVFGIDGQRLLVPTTATAATPLRRVRFSPSSARETVTLHRFQGEASLEVRATRLSVSATHFGVRRFDGREARSHTTLHVGEAPRLIPPRTHEAIFLPFPQATEAGLHALRHAVVECLPLIVENAEDVGVGYATEAELERAGLVLWDRHPEGLGAVHDLQAADILALLTECRALLNCTCASHCAQCCESVSCTTPEAPLDRHAASAAIEPLLVPRALRFTG